MLKGLKEIITDDLPHLQPLNNCCSFLIAANRNYCFFFFDSSYDLHQYFVFSLSSHGQCDPSPLPPNNLLSLAVINDRLCHSAAPYLRVSVNKHDKKDICFSEVILPPPLALQSSPTCTKGCVCLSVSHNDRIVEMTEATPRQFCSQCCSFQVPIRQEKNSI